MVTNGDKRKVSNAASASGISQPMHLEKPLLKFGCLQNRAEA